MNDKNRYFYITDDKLSWFGALHFMMSNPEDIFSPKYKGLQELLRILPEECPFMYRKVDESDERKFFIQRCVELAPIYDALLNTIPELRKYLKQKCLVSENAHTNITYRDYSYEFIFPEKSRLFDMYQMDKRAGSDEVAILTTCSKVYLTKIEISVAQLNLGLIGIKLYFDHAEGKEKDTVYWSDDPIKSPSFLNLISGVNERILELYEDLEKIRSVNVKR